MENLLTRLNTYASLNNATSDEKKYGAGIYVDFGNESETYGKASFKKVIDSIVGQALNSEEPLYNNIAQDVQNCIDEQSSAKILEVMVYDPKTDDFLRNVLDEESKVMELEDSVSDYIVKKEISDGENTKQFNYLDIVVNLKSPVGGK